ncbi:MAG TPA: hypothetical protein VFH06_03775 [Candidatus Saccharimonadales bacterium]|nr:hypothetical protein [Candidatus Saccharimonadales bacterium]
MSYPIGGDFLPNPRHGSALEFVAEKMGLGVQALKDFAKEIKAAKTAEARWAIVKELQVKRRAAKAGYIGLVKIRISLGGSEATVLFNLEKKVAPEDWPDWEITLHGIDGIERADQTRAYQVTLTLGDFYRDEVKATRVAETAAELLHLTKGDSAIEFDGD